MKKKAMIALTLAAALVLGGCGSSGGAQESTESTEAGADTEAAAEESAGGGEAAEGTAGGEKKVIGVSLMTLQYEFFQDVKAGIEEAAGDEYEIVFNDPALDMQKQIDAVENFCSQGVDAIILNAVDGSGIVPALETAEEKGIPVITVDMKPEGGKFETYIGSDNFLGGELAAKWALQNLLQDKPDAKVVFLTNPLSSAAIERIDGFKSVLSQEAPDVRVVAEQGADTRETFMSTMEDILMANPEIDLVFSYSAQGGLGAYDAIQAAGREGEISVIGFDASAEEQDVIAEDGCYKGSIMQFPKELGKTCVESVTKVLAGETLEEEIGVEVGVYTKDGIIYAADLQ